MKKLEIEDVAQFLSDRLGKDVSGVERLFGGEWSQAFGYRCQGDDLVVRFGDYVDDFEKDRAATHFNSPHLPVPQVVEIGAAFDGHFCISERAFGEMLERLDAPKMEGIVPQVFLLLDSLRDADVEKWTSQVGRPTVTWQEQLLSVDEENDRVFGWHDRMASSSVGLEIYQKGLAYLQTHIHNCPNALHLQHNDLLHNNVIVSDGRIAGVFDWGCAGCGDFIYELAMFSFYAPWFPTMAGIDWVAEARNHYAEIAVDVPNFEERLRCYEIHLGLSGMAYSSFKENWPELEVNAKHLSARLE